jgi:hypothetical protein
LEVSEQALPKCPFRPFLSTPVGGLPFASLCVSPEQSNFDAVHCGRPCFSEIVYTQASQKVFFSSCPEVQLVLCKIGSGRSSSMPDFFQVALAGQNRSLFNGKQSRERDYSVRRAKKLRAAENSVRPIVTISVTFDKTDIE